MRFDELLRLTGRLPWFDLATVVQLAGGRRQTLTNQLCRWAQAGKLLPLRRGMYAIAAPYRQAALQPAALANALYVPSYLSGLWALGFYGLIPEGVFEFTSVTTRTPRTFANSLGRFTYANLKRDSFFGYRAVELAGARVLLANPEKALLDHWHLTSGEWSLERFRAMRYQNPHLVKRATLLAQATRFGRPRLRRAAAAWLKLMADDEGVEV